jgi:hypothetical protein
MEKVMTNNELIGVLKKRFLYNMHRHEGIEWGDVEERIKTHNTKLRSLLEMERTGGEPDVVFKGATTGAYVFMDCSEESPVGRRNTCYDGKGQEERNKKGVFPSGNAVDMAAEMGIELLTEEQYRFLQRLGNFDTKTSSWLKTPPEIRKLGGAIFGDYRYGQVFVYHNSAPSFYSSRGFRGVLKV